jgi:16S rRNA processing protein RimM
LQIGQVRRPHGLTGDVIVALFTNRDERLAPGTELRDTDGRVLRIVRSSPHRGRHIVRFEGVDGIEAADAIRDVVLWAEPLAEPDTLWVHELIGAEVRDRDGKQLGIVAAVEANPASDLLVLDGGALIPLRFVVDHTPGVRVTVDVPTGLLE